MYMSSVRAHAWGPESSRDGSYCLPETKAKRWWIHDCLKRKDRRAGGRSARLGSVRHGSTWLGSAHVGSAHIGSTRLGTARLISAMHGSAQLGSAGLISALHGSALHGSARLGLERPPYVGLEGPAPASGRHRFPLPLTRLLWLRLLSRAPLVKQLSSY